MVQSGSSGPQGRDDDRLHFRTSREDRDIRRNREFRAQPSNTNPVEIAGSPEPPASPPPAPPIVRPTAPTRTSATRRCSNAGPGHVASATGILIEGGIVASGGNVGTILGAGGFIFPFDNDEIAVQVDGHFRQANSVGGFYGSGNVVQYFHIPNLPFTPFAGAGIPVIRSGGATRVGAK